MFCTSKEQETCEVEKYGYEGCYYNSKEIEEKLKLSKVDMEEDIKEKTADEMFEELGYKKLDNHPDEEKEDFGKWTTQDCRVIQYTQTGTFGGMFYTLFIRFLMNGKVVEVGAGERKEESKELARYRNPIFNMQELQAINKKCKELGWN